MNPVVYNVAVDLTGGSKTSNKEKNESLLTEEILSKQCHFAVFDKSILDNHKVVIPYDEFVSFLDRDFLCKIFVCKICNVNSGILYERQSCYIANSINMVCSCGAIGSIKARMRKNANHYKKWKDYTLMRLCKASAFELNAKYLMALQQCSTGINDAAIYTGMLDLAVSPIHVG
jgi:hypothetical protein